MTMIDAGWRQWRHLRCQEASSTENSRQQQMVLLAVRARPDETKHSQALENDNLITHVGGCGTPTPPATVVLLAVDAPPCCTRVFKLAISKFPMSKLPMSKC